MSVTKTNIIDFITEYSRGRADATAIDRFYDETVRRLGRQGWLATIELVALVADQATFTLPSSAINLLAVWYDDTQLSLDTTGSLEAAAGEYWRDQRGAPVSYVRMHESDRTFRLFPKPERPSAPFSFVFGEPLGRDFLGYHVAVLMTQQRTTLPEWLKLPVAFEILAREFQRESRHRDMQFAKECRELSGELLVMVQ